MEKESFIDFGGKVVVVSGASSGIGRAISVELSTQGARMVLLGRNYDHLKETEGSLAGTGHQVLTLDLEKCKEIMPKIKELSSHMGKIYGLCHAAGIVETKPLAAIDVENTKRMIEINFLSGIELARAISRKDIMEEGGGSILFIASVYGHVGVPAQIGYCGTKGAILSAAKAMAIELARRKIRVNTLSPGLVRTAMTEKALSILSKEQVANLANAHPLGIGAPEDVARAAAFLLAPQNTWITGADLIIDGGYSAR